MTESEHVIADEIPIIDFAIGEEPPYFHCKVECGEEYKDNGKNRGIFPGFIAFCFAYVHWEI